MKSFFTLIKEVIIPVVTVVTAVMVAILNNSVAKVEAQLQVSQEQRAERESFQSFDLKIYDKVIESLEAEDPQKQKVAQALVVVMASDSFRVKLLNVLQKTAEDTVKKEVEKIIQKENQYNTEQKSVSLAKDNASATEKWQNYNYDIFWCEESGDQAEKNAELVKNHLLEKGVRGTVRVRQLPESINSRSGYRISGDIIRANLDEWEIATHLQIEMLDVLQMKFAVTPSSQSTPGYISAFICQ